MGRMLVIAATAIALAAGGPVALPDSGKASAQSGACTCVAAFDAIDSDLRNLGRRSHSATVAAPADGCATACSAWRREWFTRDACENPTRINRGTRAIWGSASGRSETFVGTDTWWCPFPPP